MEESWVLGDMFKQLKKPYLVPTQLLCVLLQISLKPNIGLCIHSA